METEETILQPVPSEPSNPEGAPDSEDSPPLESNEEANEDVSPQPVPDERTEVFNKTPRRIAIKPKGKEDRQDEYLVISPFSTKVLSKNAADRYDTERW